MSAPKSLSKTQIEILVDLAESDLDVSDLDGRELRPYKALATAKMARILKDGTMKLAAAGQRYLDSLDVEDEDTDEAEEEQTPATPKKERKTKTTKEPVEESNGGTYFDNLTRLSELVAKRLDKATDEDTTYRLRTPGEEFIEIKLTEGRATYVAVYPTFDDDGNPTGDLTAMVDTRAGVLGLFDTAKATRRLESHAAVQTCGTTLRESLEGEEFSTSIPDDTKAAARITKWVLSIDTDETCKGFKAIASAVESLLG
mgnify:CR=1 FL=1